MLAWVISPVANLAKQLAAAKATGYAAPILC